MHRIGHRAIVIGGSLAGLLAARVAADHFDQVVVLDRDHLPDTPTTRKGVPQGPHAHGLISRGREAMEELLPGLTDDLVALGAVCGDSGHDTRRYVDGMRHARFRANRTTLCLSRPRIEFAVRRRVAALHNVTIRGRCEVTEPIASDDRVRITGVIVRERDGAGAAVPLAADLVIDASGRGSRLPRWLEALGYAAPEEDRVETGMSYATRYYRRKPTDLDGQIFCSIAAAPPCRRAGVLLAVEDDQWVLSVGGFLGDHAPTDAEGFTEYAKGLAAPDLHRLILDAEPLSDVMRFGSPASVRRRYEKLARFPGGCLAIGDALSCFNPIYGQGITVAALEALALRECLSRGDGDFAARFFRRAATFIDTPWKMAVSNDLRFPEIAGRRSRVQPVIQAYLRRFHRAARLDPTLSLAFIDVLALRKSPASLLSPRLAWRVLMGNLRTRDDTTSPALPGALVR